MATSRRLGFVSVLLALACCMVAPASTAAGPKAADVKPNVWLVGHANVDLACLRPKSEALDTLNSTFGTICGLMDEYPFVLSQGQAALYEETKRSWPEVYAQIKERARRGQWDVSTASAWSDSDLNLASGESIVRSILLAKRFIKQEFGIEPAVAWHPDTIGHPWTLPQILSKSGIKYYYGTGPWPPLFRWQSPDGSRVLAYSQAHRSTLKPDELGADAAGFCNRSGVSDYMRVYGVADGQAKASLEAAMSLKDRPGYGDVRFSSAVDYFEKIPMSGRGFPVISTELNPVLSGSFTSNADIKRYNRECENNLASAEALASIASAHGAAYPAADFTASWKKTCFNQSRDILAGTASQAAYDYAKQLRNEVVGQTTSALTASVETLAAQINTRGGGIPIVVFNPLAWTRTDYVTVTSPFANESTEVKIVDPDGRVFAGRSLGNQLTFTARDVPAMGYKVFWVSRAARQFGSNVAINGTVAENQFFRVNVHPDYGVITGIYDKVNKRSVTIPNQYTGLLQILLEDSRSMSAWNLGHFKGKKTLMDESELVRIDTGPAKVTLQYDHRYGNSIFTQELTLYDAVPRIDIKLAADWREPWVKDKTTPMLKIAFVSNLKNPKATFEIPFGSIARPKNGQEVVGQKWADLSDADYGVSILNDCKYGFDASGNMLRMSLLRTPNGPDHQADLGLHEMTFSIYPHKGDWRAAGTVRRAYELNQPLIATVATSHDGTLPRSKSFVSVSAPNLVVTALKQAEDGDGMILRLYETNGQACDARVRLGLPARTYVETDLMENPIGQPRPIDGGEFSVKAGKYEIKTYKIMN